MDDALRALLLRGQRAYQAGDYDQAEAILREAKAQGAFADVCNMLGVIYHQRGLLDAAKDCLEEALHINPRYTEAALNLAVTYNEMGRYDDARQVYGQALSAAPKTDGEIEPFARGKIANLHAAVADAYVSIGRPELAITEYRAALALAPQFADIRKRLASALRDSGQLEEAATEFQRVKQER